MANPPLSDPKRYITDHDDKGTSFFSKTTSESIPVSWDLGGAQMRLAYTTMRPPAELSKQSDLKVYTTSLQNLPPLVPIGGGANVWYIDTPPGTESPMHRTVSLDFVIQVSGEVELTMSSGETRLVKPGDMVIQRGTLHKWRNLSETQWSRMVGILAEVQPMVTDSGETIAADFPSH